MLARPAAELARPVLGPRAETRARLCWTRTGGLVGAATGAGSAGAGALLVLGCDDVEPSSVELVPEAGGRKRNGSRYPFGSVVSRIPR
jgi:hypothetical protein